MNTFVVTEKPPMAGPITSGEYARKHIEAFDRYQLRVPPGTHGLGFYLTLDPGDLIMLQKLTVRRDLGEGAESDDETFGGDEETREELADEDDVEFGDPRDVKGSGEGIDTKVKVSEGKDRLARMKEALSEASLKREIRIQFGPRSVLESLEFLRKIRMPASAYISLTGGSDYVYEWKQGIKWIGGLDTSLNENRNCPADKALREVFLNNVQPFLLREELKQKYCRNLNVLRKTFLMLYDKNYATIRDASALGARPEKASGVKEEVDFRRSIKMNYDKDPSKKLKNPRNSFSVHSVGGAVTGGPAPEVICHGCGKPGHYKNKCPSASVVGGRPVPSPVRPQNLNQSYAASSTPVRLNPGSVVNFASPVVTGRQSPQWNRGYPSAGGPNRGTPSKSSQSASSSPMGKLNGAILRQDVTEKRAVVAALIGNAAERRATLQANVFVDTGSDANLISSSWLPTLRAEGVVVEEVEPVEVRWTLSDVSGRAISRIVRLRVEFIGWTNAPRDYVESFLVTEADRLANAGPGVHVPHPVVRRFAIDRVRTNRARGGFV